MTVHGPAAVLALCLRCVAVLALVNVPLVLAVQLVTDPSALAGQGWSQGVAFLCYVLLVAAVPVLVVGFPAGVLTAHLVRRSRREAVHVGAFALVGAALSVALCVGFGVVQPVSPHAVLAALEGAVGAGGARWWSGWARRRRAGRPRTPTDEDVEDAVLDDARG
ncbi:hypothetical protein [Cellulomonas sp. ICMP 17802]|uniref:hypothetical protein n=1 Tax=Cellulomonas sp. ICMP 17802 TaxID=3239199 RepID=UPI00351B0BE3